MAVVESKFSFVLLFNIKSIFGFNNLAPELFN